MKRTFTKIILVILGLLGCDDFVTIDPPRTDIVRSSVFLDVSTADASVVDLYISMRDGFGGGAESGVTAMTAVSSDELELYGSSISRSEFADNEIAESNSIIESLWSQAYGVIYKANAVLEGLGNSPIPPAKKDQFRGEALFARAFSYFYLVNLWGDVPLVTSTNHEINNRAARVPSVQVYDQIVTDLMTAKDLLLEQMKQGSIRAGRGAAMALLARVYLYRGDWKSAELESAAIIESGVYSLESDLNQVFNVSSSEAILQLWNSIYPREALTFFIHPALNAPVFGSLRPTYLNTFDPNDLRYVNWVIVYPTTATTYYGANKYKSLASPAEDYSTLLRLAEVYLIHAEALAQQGEISLAAKSLNVIRTRAGLSPTHPSTQQEMLDAIYLERKHELFAEQGHRWLDLKRIGMADSVLSQLKPTWDHEDRLYPIPASQITGNPDMVQNPIGS